MTTRTFIQFGQAYRNSTVTVVASLDGTEIFNGVVPNGYLPPDSTTAPPASFVPSSPTVTALFSFTEDVTFAGTKQLTMTVTGGDVWMNRTVADYAVALPGLTYPTVEQDTFGLANFYGPIYAASVGNLVIADPLSNVFVNGVASPSIPTAEMINGVYPEGQWCRTIPDGGNLTATINISAGSVVET